MFTGLFKFLFPNKAAMSNKELEEKIRELESTMEEMADVIRQQSALTTIIAGIQCDIITFINEKPDVKKMTSSDIEDALIKFAVDDDDFIN